jgi:hypothetical protein
VRELTVDATIDGGNPMRITTRIRSAAGGVALALTAAGAVTVVTAQPAHADTAACRRSLTYFGYHITEHRRRACADGASGRAGAYVLCYDRLFRVTKVNSNVAGRSCRHAAQ